MTAPQPGGGRLAGKVALVTGAAGGQGRAHAVRLAEEGAEILALDVCAPVLAGSQYPMPDPGELEQTARLVEATGHRVIARVGDVRDFAALRSLVADGAAELGGLDVVVANAGIPAYGPLLEIDEAEWNTVLDVNLTGAWTTLKAAAPAMIEAGRGGSVVLTSSFAGLRGLAGVGHYAAAKTGLVGLMRNAAIELGPHGIRVNTVHPGCTNTDMLMNDEVYALFRPDLDSPTAADIEPPLQEMTLLPVPYVEPVDIANAVLWLASDEARYVTGVTLPVDAGWHAK